MATGIRGYLNNFSTTLTAAITNSATSMTLAAFDGIATLLTTADYIAFTLVSGTNIEIVHATASASGVMTIERAQEGTTAFAFDAGTKVEIRVTAASFDVAAPAGGGDWELIETRTLSGSVNEFAFTGLTAGRYQWIFDGVGVTADPDPVMYMQVGHGATPTYASSGYRYAIAKISDNTSAVAETIPGSTAEIWLVPAFPTDNALFALNGTIESSDIATTTQYKSFDIDLRTVRSGGAPQVSNWKGVGAWQDTTVMTALKFKINGTGNFRDGGIIHLRKRTF